MPNYSPSTENEIAFAVLLYLAGKPDGMATIRTIIANVPKYIALTDADREVSVTRPNEEMWEQKVRNITSHHKSAGNFVHDGYLERLPRKLRITDKGRRLAAKRLEKT